MCHQCRLKVLDSRLYCYSTESVPEASIFQSQVRMPNFKCQNKMEKKQQPQNKQKSFVFSVVLLAVGCNWKRHASNTSLVRTMKLILKRIPHTQTHESIFYAHKHKHVSKHTCMLCSVFVYTRKRKWDCAMSETLILHHLVIFNVN